MCLHIRLQIYLNLSQPSDRIKSDIVILRHGLVYIIHV